MDQKLNGGNLAPKMSANRRPFVDFSADFAALNMPLTRLHDTPLENPAMRLVDVPMVFRSSMPIRRIHGIIISARPMTIFRIVWIAAQKSCIAWG